MQSKAVTITAPLSLLIILPLGCTEKPTEPQLTEEEIRQIIAEELAKMNATTVTNEALTPAQIIEKDIPSSVDRGARGGGYILFDKLPEGLRISGVAAYQLEGTKLTFSTIRCSAWHTGEKEISVSWANNRRTFSYWCR